MSMSVGSESGEDGAMCDINTTPLVDIMLVLLIIFMVTAPLLNLYDTDWPIWTYQPQLPPAKFVHNQDDRRGMAIESMVSGGWASRRRA